MPTVEISEVQRPPAESSFTAHTHTHFPLHHKHQKLFNSADTFKNEKLKVSLISLKLLTALTHTPRSPSSALRRHQEIMMSLKREKMKWRRRKSRSRLSEREIKNEINERWRAMRRLHSLTFQWGVFSTLWLHILESEGGRRLGPGDKTSVVPVC